LPHPQGRRGGLERRYQAGEGAEFADAGAAAAEFVTAINRADFDRVFDELIVPELRIENRSRSAFPDRSAAELRASVEELDAMVASVRTWNSPFAGCRRRGYVARHEREARRARRRAIRMDAACRGRVPRRATRVAVRFRRRGRGAGVRLRRGADAGHVQPAGRRESVLRDIACHGQGAASPRH